MAFSLYKCPGTSTPPTMRCIADTAGVVGGQVVKLEAGTSGETRPKVVQVTGDATNSDLAYGVALHDAASGVEVLVMPILSGMRFLADAAATPDIVNAGTLKGYLAATAGQAITINATALTQLQAVIDIVGVSDDLKKYIVAFNPAAVKSF